MAVASTNSTSALRLGSAYAGATTATVAAFGAVAGLAGVEHGIGEILQGPVRPDALVIESWPNSEAFAVLSGEPSFTVIPNLAVSGVLAISVAIGLAVWAVGFADRRHGGWVLLGLSVLLFLVGGGFGPPLIGAVLAGAVLRGPGGSGVVARAMAPWWPWLLGVGVGAFLGLVPGTALLSHVVGLQSAGLVVALSATAFTCLILSLVAARARDG
jgi:hypothetical protein